MRSFERIDPYVRRVAQFIIAEPKGRPVPKSAYDHRIAYVLRGCFAMEIDGRAFPCAPHTLLYWRPGQWYRVIPEEGSPADLLTVFFDFDQDRAGMRIPASPPTRETFDPRWVGEGASFAESTPFEAPFAWPRAAGLGMRLAAMRRATLLEQPFVGAYLNAQLRLLLLEMACRHATLREAPALGPHEAERALAYLHHNANRQAHCAALAQELHYHPNALNRLVKATTGLSMHAFIQRIRVQNARDMLEHTEETVVDIAQALGFVDSSHFAKVFRQHTGMSPQAYRQANRV